MKHRFEELKTVKRPSNEGEDQIGRDEAFVWSVAQLTTLNASQLRAVRCCLFD
jgi:hypothetical protein